MRSTAVLIYVSIAALLTLLLSQVFGWPGGRYWFGLVWALMLLVVIVGILADPRWIGAFTYLSAVALMAAVLSQLFGWSDGRSWSLMAWAILLLPVAIGLFSHPMRGPAWGLFAGFWGVVGVIWLIVLQILGVGGLLRGADYGAWTAWPLALIGIWILVASGTGFAGERFPRGVDVLGLLTGAGLLAISIATWAGAPDLTRTAGLVAATAYCLWSAGIGWVFWGLEPMSARFRGVTARRRLQTDPLPQR